MECKDLFYLSGPPLEGRFNLEGIGNTAGRTP